jgi:hypothetical protein
MRIPNEHKDTLFFGGRTFPPLEWCNFNMAGRDEPFIALRIKVSTDLPVRLRLIQNGTANDYLLKLPLSEVVVMP